MSVALSDELLSRVAAEAAKRGLKLSPTVRALVTERVEQIDDQQQLTAAEEWQRHEAWASWEKLKEGRVQEVSREDLRAAFLFARKVKG